ncbi:MAG: class I adenylate-forming enzyme family protein [Actinomycetota bacterium]|nr:class I adenylate-forming enzyme family protein [Actinomycetota bacterium]
MTATVPSLLTDRARSRPDHPFVICDDEVLTYGDADVRSAVLAKGLLAGGVGPGTHVGLLLPNGVEATVGALAAARIGSVAVPISTFSTPTELATILLGADVHTVIAANSYRSHDYVERLTEAVPGLETGRATVVHSPALPGLRQVYFSHRDDRVCEDRTVGGLTELGRQVDDAVLQACGAAVGPADRLVIVHTSGSVAQPKGVIHQHGSLLAHLDVLNEVRRFRPEDRLFCNAPFFWIGGYGYALMGAFVAGATLICSNAEPGGVLDLLERAKPTMCNGFVASVAALPRDPSFPGRDLSSIRRGNLYPIMAPECRPVDPELRHNMLGMTETGSVCLASPDEGDQPEERRGSFGAPVSDVEAKVISPATGELCGSGQVGELCLRGAALMEGYWGRERHEVFDADGWYHTGDLFATDRGGYFYFRGRNADMIKTAGANVSPREVEAAILGETGLVAHVIGVDDDLRGQVVAAAVRVPPGSRHPAAHDLRRQLRSRLSAYKVPQRILFLGDDEVPTMSSGKLDIRALKARFSEQ